MRTDEAHQQELEHQEQNEEKENDRNDLDLVEIQQHLGEIL